MILSSGDGTNLKPGPTGPPNIYPVGKVSKVSFTNGVKAYPFSSSQYVQEAVNNF